MTNRFTSETDRLFFDPSLECHSNSERAVCSQLRSQLFYLWTFVALQDLLEDALDFLDDHYYVHDPLDIFSDVPF